MTQITSDDATREHVSITDADVEAAHGLLEFIQACPSMFHTAQTIARRLDDAGFTRLREGDAWSVEPGSCCYVVRNNSSVIAFKVGEGATDSGRFHFQLSATHGDSPTFKVKDVATLDGPEGGLRLNVEAYGGMIDYTWFDRPLSLAGRVFVQVDERVESRLVSLDRPVAMIPSLAIHLDRSMNDAFSPNRATDVCPLVSAGLMDEATFDRLVADAAGVEPEQVLARDLFLVNLQQPCVWGAEHEFISSPKLDDLMCAYVSLEAFLEARNTAAVSVYCCFDNEEVGSNTKQGAMSTFLPDVLVRLSAALGAGEEGYRRALAKSMLVSCDNAHAVHPNHPERYDASNRCRLNGGLVVKEAANQHYCTDAFSRAVLAAVCRRAEVPLQTFANRSDMAGGSTLGNLSNIQASMHAVDVGCPQLAMHSSYETAGTRDVTLATKALKAFFEADLRIVEADAVDIA
ncbi:M18 family aminopeptidase [Collinsella sp. An2]|uniref:M18 family aminopeptidase n=1 Tax=Collinsella sp. An2 TaxID=1965585 RepID=UPI00194E6AB0|nr:M18 family aminopeptidase [Collinsella sp. An2]